MDATQNRTKLIHAALTLVQSWIAAGRPVGKKSLGSFEDWAATMGGILHHTGVSGFLENMEKLYEAADQEGQEWRAFVEVWWDNHRDKYVAATELLQLAETHDLLGFVVGDKSDRSKQIRLGRALSAARDRRFGPYKVIAGIRSHAKAAQYRLTRADEESNNGEILPFLRDIAGCGAGCENSHPAGQPTENQ